MWESRVTRSIDSKAGGLQALGGRGRGLSPLSNTHSTSPKPITRENQQTRSQNCPGRVRARPNDLPRMQRLPHEDHSPPVGCPMTPTDVPIVK